MGRRKGKTSPVKKEEFVNRPFAGLQALKHLATNEKRREEKTPSTIQVEDDAQLFLEEVKDVRPLDKPAAIPPRATPGPPLLDVSEREALEVRRALERMVASGEGLVVPSPDEIVEGSNEGADLLLLEKLKQGEFSIRAFLDLHGMDRIQARQAVEEFIDQSLLQGKRCLLIICGRGRNSPDKQPVLKNLLHSWFSRSALRKKVLAWCTARPCDGGAGALYVLLRRPS